MNLIANYGFAVWINRRQVLKGGVVEKQSGFSKNPAGSVVSQCDNQLLFHYEKIGYEFSPSPVIGGDNCFCKHFHFGHHCNPEVRKLETNGP